MHMLDRETPDFEMCPVYQELNTKPGQLTAVAVWQNPSATDNSGDKPTVTCKPSSGSNFAIGQTLVTCEAVDGSGNINICSFQIYVKGTYVLGKRCMMNITRSSICKVTPKQTDVGPTSEVVGAVARWKCDV